jgi:hypothetical protein
VLIRRWSGSSIPRSADRHAHLSPRALSRHRQPKHHHQQRPSRMSRALILVLVNRILLCLALLLCAVGLTACGGSNAKSRSTLAGSPNVIAVSPPGPLSPSRKAAFSAGEVVVGQTGCLACHLIGHDGNNGPGPPLTHEGAHHTAASIAAVLKDPTAPMPSFSGLAQQYPQKFKELVEFISMLR